QARLDHHVGYLPAGRVDHVPIDLAQGLSRGGADNGLPFQLEQFHAGYLLPRPLPRERGTSRAAAGSRHQRIASCQSPYLSRFPPPGTDMAATASPATTRATV